MTVDLFSTSVRWLRHEVVVDVATASHGPARVRVYSNVTSLFLLLLYLSSTYSMRLWHTRSASQFEAYSGDIESKFVPQDSDM